MVFSKRRIVLAALFSLSLILLTADRLFLDSPALGPDEAEASSVSEYAVDRPDETSLLASLPEAPACEQAEPLSDRLRELAKASRLDAAAASDAFRPPAAWLVQQRPAPAPAPPPPDAGKVRGEKFLQQHKLMATAITASGAMAIIDGQCLVVGGELDGFRLVRVGRDHAVLACGKVEVTLQLPQEPPGPEDDA